jgi:hypothetical protein
VPDFRNHHHRREAARLRSLDCMAAGCPGGAGGGYRLADAGHLVRGEIYSLFGESRGAL